MHTFWSYQGVESHWNHSRGSVCSGKIWRIRKGTRLKVWAIPVLARGGGAAMENLKSQTEERGRGVCIYHSRQGNGVFWEKGDHEQRGVINNKVKNKNYIITNIYYRRLNYKPVISKLKSSLVSWIILEKSQLFY